MSKYNIKKSRRSKKDVITNEITMKTFYKIKDFVENQINDPNYWKKFRTTFSKIFGIKFVAIKFDPEIEGINNIIINLGEDPEFYEHNEMFNGGSYWRATNNLVVNLLIPPFDSLSTKIFEKINNILPKVIRHEVTHAYQKKETIIEIFIKIIKDLFLNNNESEFIKYFDEEEIEAWAESIYFYGKKMNQNPFFLLKKEIKAVSQIYEENKDENEDFIFNKIKKYIENKYPNSTKFSRNNMNWYELIKKSSPLPTLNEGEDYPNYNQTISLIDYIFTEEDARQFEKDFPHAKRIEGHGSFGIAYDTGYSIVKLTMDRTEKEMAKKIINGEIGNKDIFPKIYDIKEYPTKNYTYRISAIEMEKIQILNDNEIMIFDKIEELITEYFHSNYSLNEVYDKIEEEYPRITPEEIEKMLEEYIKLYKKLEKENLAPLDLHGGNVGWKNNQLVILDLGQINDS